VRIAYMDESGDGRKLPAQPSSEPITPVVILAAVAIDQSLIENLTREFIRLKSRWFPGLVGSGPHRLSRILPEVKGADIRRSLRQGAPHRNRRQAIGFLDGLVGLLEYHDARIFGRVWVKELGQPCNDKAIYTFSVQDICLVFNNLLEAKGDVGWVVADSRSPAPNAAVSHSIFTQKFRVDGDRYPRVLEMPTFGHSQNHAGLQVVDLVCSAMLFPMATYAYCTGQVQSVHVDPGFRSLTDRYGTRLRRLQHRYEDDAGRTRGGITVSDPLGRQSGAVLFQAS
jgi:uncharacterized protein DUF3800